MSEQGQNKDRVRRGSSEGIEGIECTAHMSALQQCSGVRELVVEARCDR